MIEIIGFYEFKYMSTLGELADVRAALRQLFMDLDIRGTIILADEGFNGMVCGTEVSVAKFTAAAGKVLQTELRVKSSMSDSAPFRKIDIKIKPEIVTLKKSVDMTRSEGTHIAPKDWNSLISDPSTLVLDARNHYEFTTGTFRNAVDPNIKKFSDLPAFVENDLDPNKHKTVAMFCTGGIRCEKFAPYMKQLGFENVYQLDGGILKYLEEVPAGESLWEGECFVFDERVTVDKELQKGTQPDHSQRRKTKAA
jgi:UPF0176 protein